MSESTYSQRYATGDSNTAGAFAFDTINSKDYAISKVAFGAVGSVTYVDASNPLPVTAASLPLPTGAATSAKQDTGNTSLSSIDGKITACNTGAVVVSSSALPSGASTAANQATVISALSSIVLLIDGVEGSLSSIDGKITACNTGAVTISAALPAGTNAIGKLAANAGVTIGAVEIAAAQTLATVTTVSTVTTCSTVSTLTGSGVAHDAVDSGNPHKIGAKATTSLSGETLVANADRTDLRAGADGVLLSRPHTNLEDIVTGNASNTDGTNTSCIAAQGAGVKTYIQSIILTNTSSSNIYVEIKDGTTAKLTIPVPANGGAVVNLPVPVGGTANTAWNFDPSAATSTVFCSMVGWKSKV